MQKWLSHQMEIEKLYLSLKFVGKQIKFLQRQPMFWPFVFRTELTIEVADVGDFEVASSNHKHRLYKKKKDFITKSFFGDSLGARTQDPNIKSVVLYLLS